MGTSVRTTRLRPTRCRSSSRSAISFLRRCSSVSLAHLANGRSVDSWFTLSESISNSGIFVTSCDCDGCSAPGGGHGAMDGRGSGDARGGRRDEARRIRKANASATTDATGARAHLDVNIAERPPPPPEAAIANDAGLSRASGSGRRDAKIDFGSSSRTLNTLERLALWPIAAKCDQSLPVWVKSLSIFRVLYVRDSYSSTEKRSA